MNPQGFRGEITVPLPDAPAPRAAMFARLAEAWSLLLSSVETIQRDAVNGATKAAPLAKTTAKPKRRKHRRKGRA